jgi:AcrR family transcriptional regulator
MEVVELAEPPEYPGSDPAQRLSSTGKRVLDAARRLLAKRGYSGLSLDAIAKEADESKSAVHYHFGGKSGLTAALADSVMYDDYLDEIRLATARRTKPVDEVATLVSTSRISATDRVSYLTFFDLFPHMARDADLRARLTTVYDWYRELDAWTLAPAVDPRLRERLESLAALTVAVADGLAMQRLADPKFDTDSAFDSWDAILRLVLDNLEEIPAAEE